MIPSREEIRRSVWGAVLLARGNVAGMGCFDLSFDGFWRSFAAPVIAAPLYALLMAEQYARTGFEGHPGPVVLFESLAYLLDIVTFPVLAVFLTRYLRLGARYVPLVVATNWAALPQAALFLVAVTLGSTLPAPLRSSLVLAAMLGTLVYQWFVIKVALGSTGNIAAAFVVLNLLVGIMMNRMLDAVL